MKNNNSRTTNNILALGLCLGLTSLSIHSAHAQTAEPAKPPTEVIPALVSGDAFPKDALKGITWIQGEPVNSLEEKDKVYIIECWATWCGPCIAAIPHVNEIHQKYESKGLVVIGMNVWEDGLEKPQNFVKSKGQSMSYRVAYSGGRESAFVDKVLKPAGVKGIPRALVVKDGKFLLSIHPNKLKEELIEGLLDGSLDVPAYNKEQREAEIKQSAFIDKLRRLQKAGDWDGVKKLGEGLDDSDSIKFSLLSRAAIMTNNWTDLFALRQDIKNNRFNPHIKPYMLDASIVRDITLTEETADTAKKFAEIALTELPEPSPDAKPERAFDNHFSRARLLFMANKTDEAKKALTSASECTEKIASPYSKAYYKNIATSAIQKLNEGSFPSTRELIRK